MFQVEGHRPLPSIQSEAKKGPPPYTVEVGTIAEDGSLLDWRDLRQNCARVPLSFVRLRDDVSWTTASMKLD
jgi:hypothetical protein